MRALVLTAFCCTGIGAMFFTPYLGILMWHWLSLMNPHKLAYGGFTLGLPIILATAVCSLISWLISSEPKRLPLTGLSVTLITFTAWVSITTIFAFNPAQAFDKWDQVIRIIGMAIVTLIMTTSQLRIVVLTWLTALSVGFYGVKGGIWGILTGGSGRVYGPEGTLYGENNTFGMALLMTIPLWIFMIETTKHKLLKNALMAGVALLVISTLLTYSRGAFLGLAILAFVMWLSSNRKILFGGLLAVVIAVGLPLMPDAWWARMDTVEKYEEDGSAMGRLRQWHLAIEVAKDNPILGGGFKMFVTRAVNDRYAGIIGPGATLEAHSIYFQILGEQGPLGLMMFLGLIIGGSVSSVRTYYATRKRPDLFVPNRLSRALFLSMIGFAAPGAFLSQAYFDMFYLLIVLIIVQGMVAKQALREGLPPVPAKLSELLLSAVRPPSPQRRPGVAHG